MVVRLTFALTVAFTAWGQSNNELEKIYAQDQTDRANMLTMSAEQISKMVKNDVPRRKRVRELVDAGALNTPEDYVRAAFIFQHGDTPDDYLMAHVLGIIATKLDGSGAWIAAASLDRYLLSTGKPQIFGLQLDRVAPFNPNLVTDRMRAAVCAPSVASRAKFLRALAKDANNALPDNPCLEEISKTLAGRWLLTRKDASGQFIHLTLDCKFGGGGDPLFQLSGLGVPPRAKTEVELGGNNLKIKVDGGTFDLVVRGDTITGHYSSVSSAGTVVGMR